MKKMPRIERRPCYLFLNSNETVFLVPELNAAEAAPQRTGYGAQFTQVVTEGGGQPLSALGRDVWVI